MGTQGPVDSKAFVMWNEQSDVTRTVFCIFRSGRGRYLHAVIIHESELWNTFKQYVIFIYFIEEKNNDKEYLSHFAAGLTVIMSFQCVIETFRKTHVRL